MFQAHAAITPGLETALAEELADLGISAAAREGGVSFRCDPVGLGAVHLHSRLAGRVSIQIAKVRSGNLGQLAAAVRKLPWRDYVHRGQPVEVRVSGVRARGDMVGRKVEHAIADSLRGPRRPGPRPPREPARIGVSVAKDHAVVRVDASGELLHKRGWRQQTAKAPIRENLAAAMLWLSEWEPGECLVDPMCGSGTLPIEAACIATGRPPGAWRSFAFERWPSHDAAAYAKQVGEARSGVDPVEVQIYASDRDEGAIRATKGNARRAGVEPFILHKPFAELDPPQPSGLLCFNPPYGARVGGDYGTIGRILRERWQGWRFALLIPKRQLLGKLGLATEELASFSNGGIRVHLVSGRIGPS